MQAVQLIKNKKGSALIFVIVVLVVTTLVVAAAAFLTQANTKQAVSQENSIQTYYMARSGAELAYQALLSTPALYSQLANTSRILSDPNVNLGEGTAAVTARTVPSSSPQRIRIESVAHLTGSTLERTAVLEFDYQLHNDIVWSQ